MGYNSDENPDTSGSAVPPYEGRRTEGDIEGREATTREGARVGGATGPVEDEAPKASPPAETPRGSVASPGTEQSTGAEPAPSEPAATGPSHTPGTSRGEDVAGSS